LLKTKYKFKSITPVDPVKLESYLTVEPAIFGDGELLKTDGTPAVYVIDNMTRRSFPSGEVFENLGYKWKNVINVPEKILKLYPIGEPMQEIAVPSADTSSTTATSTTDTSIGTSTLSIASTTLPISTSSLSREIESILNP
jgi:hypothetical protein